MKQIDFLPTKYRERNSARTEALRRWMIVLSLGASIIPLAAYQFIAHLAVVMSVVNVDPAHFAAVEQSKKLDLLTQELEIAHGEAALFAWLRHPWPRSQILAKIHEPLPDTMRLTEVKVAQETKKADGPAAPRGRAARRGAEQVEVKTDDHKKAERDWQKLAQVASEQEEVVTLTGVCVDTAALHTYVAKLRLSGLFAKSELKSLESAPGQENAKAQKFEIRLVLAAGHGKVDKKAKTEAEVAAAAIHS